MKKINYTIISIGIISILTSLLLYGLGVYSLIENKLYDARFKLRGPLSDWNSKVILVEIDDESYRLIAESYPYPRGTVWSRAITNLTKAGAKVIAIDIQFDSEDHTSRTLQNYKDCHKCEILDQDDTFANSITYSIKNGSKILLASKIGYEPTRIPSDYIVLPTDAIMEANPYTGLVDHEVDAIDNVSRRYTIFSKLPSEPDNILLSFGINAVLSYLDLDKTIKIIQDVENDIIDINGLIVKAYRKEAAFLMNYYGPVSSLYKTFPRYSLSQVLDNSDYDLLLEDTDWIDMYINEKHPLYNKFGLENSPFKDKIVIIGSSLKEDHDFRETPYFSYGNNENPTPGLEFHAHAIQQLLDNNYIKVPTKSLNLTIESFLYDFLLILLFVIIILYIANNSSILISISSTLIIILSWFSFSMGIFINDYFWIFKIIINSFYVEPIYIFSSSVTDTSYLLPVCYPIATIMITYGLNLSYNLFDEQKNKNFLKDTFGRYISPELIDDMYKNKKVPELGGQSGIKTAFFSDIESFSKISEELSASQLVEFLNEFLSEQTSILIENKGTLDKYEGDGILAFFGAPVFYNKHAQHAIDTGVELQNNLNLLKNRWKKEKNRWPNSILNMNMRIGINSGEMVTGNMGSDLHMNYTMIGEEVNLASRLESGAKSYGIYFHTTYKTLEKAGIDRYNWRYIDKVIFKGFSDWKQTVEILGYKDEKNESINKLIKLFHQGLNFYYKKDWESATKSFKNSLKYERIDNDKQNNPSSIFIKRCNFYKKNPPSEDWIGIYKLDRK